MRRSLNRAPQPQPTAPELPPDTATCPLLRTVDLIGHAESSGLCGDDVRAFAMLPAAERERLMRFSGALTGGHQHVAPTQPHKNGGSPAATRPLVSYEDDDNDAL